MGKNLSNGQTELFDGEAVEKYQLAFKGAFSADEVDIAELGIDDHVCLLVIAAVSDSAFSKNKDDELIRGNKLTVLRAVELDASVANYALAKQAATAGSPMLPNFSDPEDDSYDDHRTSPDVDPVDAVDEDGLVSVDE